MDKNTAAIIIQSKNLGLAIILALLFGGLGLFYATIAGGIIMTFIWLIVAFIGFVTLGFGLVLLIPVNIICVIWAAIAVNQHNKKLIARV